MSVFDGKMMAFTVGDTRVELDPMFHWQALYIGVYVKASKTITHLWLTPLPTLQLRVSFYHDKKTGGADEPRKSCP